MANETDSALIWMRPEPSGRKPRFSRDQISRAAIEIADKDGFEAVTMKRIATQLGAGTMTLYYYVRNKTDIVALMQDAILADELLAPDELPHNWRDALAAITRRTRQVLLAHPWSLTSLVDAQFGPNASRHYEQSLQAVSSLDISIGGKIDLIGILDTYVFGSALTTVESLERGRAAASNQRLVSDAVAYGDRLLASGAFPQLAELSRQLAFAATEPGLPMSEDALERQFEVGLTALLNGLAESMSLD